MASWGVVATVKAPEEKVLAFVAHHLSLGASHTWLYFDDPEDPAHAALARHPRVTATLCDAAYWQGKNRHDRHQNRQARNAREAYRQANVDWLGHIDVDEFVLSARPVAAVLSDMPGHEPVLKLEPFEALHDPALPDDIYTARAFRGSLRHLPQALMLRVLGEDRKIIPDGMLSHRVGKVFFRTGIKGLSPRLHSVMLRGERLATPHWHPDLKLLHFHAQDRQAWQAVLPFRLTRGAYQFRPELQAYLAGADPAEIDRFYLRTQVLAGDTADELEVAGRLLRTELGLRQKVQALLAGDYD
jgi:hypothetical protein